MALRRYNDKTVPKRSVFTDQATISFQIKSGKVVFNPTARNLLWVNEGDQVEFAHDPDAEKWYVCKVQVNGFALKGKPDSMSLEFSRTTLVRMVFDSVAYTGSYGTAMIGGMKKIDGIACWELNLDRMINK